MKSWVWYALGWAPHPFEKYLDLGCRHKNRGEWRCRCIKLPDKYLTRVSDAIRNWDSKKVVDLYNSSVIPRDLNGYSAEFTELYENTELRQRVTQEYLDYRQEIDGVCMLLFFWVLTVFVFIINYRHGGSELYYIGVFMVSFSLHVINERFYSCIAKEIKTE